MKVGIIGGSCVGSYLASKLADKGISSFVLEEHTHIGTPLKCTGLISDNIRRYVKIDDVIVNNIKSAKFFFGEGKGFELKGKANVVDRTEFDRKIYREAMGKGVKYFLGEKFTDFKRDGDIEIKSKLNTHRCDFLVGADGAGSLVGSKIGVNNKVIPALQVRAKGEFETDSVELHFSEKYPDFFAWVVPESSKIARIGLGGGADLSGKLKEFLKNKKIKQAIDYQSGLIPIDYHEKFSSDGVALVGDAASQVKATTGGGVVTGFASAKILARGIEKMSKNMDFSAENIYRNYEVPWSKGIGAELKKAYSVRRMMDCFDKGDYKSIKKLFGNLKFKKTLEKNADMEEYSKFLKRCAFTPAGIIFGMKIMIKNPKLLKEVFNFF